MKEFLPLFLTKHYLIKKIIKLHSSHYRHVIFWEPLVSNILEMILIEEN